MDQLGESIRKLLLAGIGAAAVTKEKGEEVLRELVRKGELTVEQGKVLNEELKHNISEAIRENVNVTVVKPESDLMDAVDGMDAEQLSALKKLQTENGLWRTLLDDPESYEEVSASAAIAAAMVIKGNPLHLKYVNKAVEGILNNISPEGRVLNVSAGTAVMKDRDGYRNISRRWTQGWGQGLALAFLAAVLEADKLAVDGAL